MVQNYGGVNIPKNMILAMVISGALAGLGGAKLIYQELCILFKTLWLYQAMDLTELPLHCLQRIIQ